MISLQFSTKSSQIVIKNITLHVENILEEALNKKY